jgi:hypothetical protein
MLDGLRRQNAHAVGLGVAVECRSWEGAEGALVVLCVLGELGRDMSISNNPTSGPFQVEPAVDVRHRPGITVSVASGQRSEGMRLTGSQINSHGLTPVTKTNSPGVYVVKSLSASIL